MNNKRNLFNSTFYLLFFCVGEPTITTPTRAYRKSLNIRRMSLLGQRTPPRGRRLSSVQTSPTVLRQQHHLKTSLSATMITQCMRSESMISPFRHPLQPVALQPSCNIARSSASKYTLRFFKFF